MSFDQMSILGVGEVSCTTCRLALSGQNYLHNEDKPYCTKCFESQFSYMCHLCKLKIKVAERDLSYKQLHWHEACFFCADCKTALPNKPFLTKEDGTLFCPDCFVDESAEPCAGCGKPGKTGSKMYQYKGASWHEECFTCLECLKPIQTKSFVPQDKGVVCAPCYEEKFCQKCKKCNLPIKKGGVNYKDQPWHKECFTCTNCKQELAGTKFATEKDQPYCANCFTQLFAKRCDLCKLPISGFTGSRFITFEQRHWHSDCFKCNKCNQSLVGKGFMIEEDGVTCPECKRQAV